MQLSAIEQLARRINGVLQPFFDGLELQLVDFKLELGLNAAGELLLVSHGDQAFGVLRLKQNIV